MQLKTLAYKYNKLMQKASVNFNININGHNFKIPLIEDIGFSNLYLKDDWFLQIIKKLNLDPDTDIIDVGVNVGQSLLHFKSILPNRYWGFEPNPNCLHYLDNLKKLNQFEHVTIFPVGLSSHNGIVGFYSDNESDSCATIVSDLRPGWYKAKEKKYVPVFAFDQLDTTDIKKVSFLKIDVEGAELEVIKGMVQRIQADQPVILCEILDYNSEESASVLQARANELVALVHSLSYSIYKIDHHSKQVVEYSLLEEVKLKKWSDDSFDGNDYLFVPSHFDARLLQ
ncbi:FkbM family methyltransferase [Aridibaculum aurantiacum]|uniref:FkbM family methyltransferase n=1 Tax=Aridibaculum aurantiacum TaxID=2810307 RepID=UPI001A96A9B8|nr:FkbM family methyltransferase [Aridibaculum aurantiacum]